MFYTILRERPFYEELDFRPPCVDTYLQGVITNRHLLEESEVDVGSIYHLGHLYFTGAKGVGKTTQIYALMASVVHNRSVYFLKNRTFQRSFHYKCSQFHVEFSAKSFKNMSDITTSHQFVISVVSSPNIAYGIPRFVFIRDFHLCNEHNQKFFLRIIEKYSSNVRFIVEGDASIRPIEPISSRFLTLFIPAVSLEKIREVVFRRVPDLEEELWPEIVRNSSILNWIREEETGDGAGAGVEAGARAYNMKNLFGILCVHLSDRSKKIYKPTHIIKCVALQRCILQVTEKSFFEKMTTIREILLELFVNNVDSNFVLDYFMRFACAHAPEKSGLFIEEASQISHQMSMANKDIFFLELYLFFIVKHLRLVATS